MPETPPQDATRRATPWLVLAIALAVAVAAALYVDASSREADRLRFERLMQVDTDLVERRVDTYLALLRAGAAHIATTRRISKERWADYVEALDLERHYPGVQGFGWAQRVDDEAEFVAMMREAYPDYRVWPEGSPPLRTAIAYLEPLDRRNRAAIGYDMATDPVRREAMERAWRTGEPSASGRVVLVQEIDPAKQAGFLLYVPVFVPPLPSTSAQRDAQLRGFVYAPFRVEDLLEAVLGDRERPYLSLEVYDGERVEEGALLYRDPSIGAHDPRYVDVRRLDVAGRPWTLRLSSKPSFERLSGTRLRIPVLLGGVAIALLLFAVTRSLVRAREDAEASAAEARASAVARAQSERRYRALVEQSPLSTQIFGPDGRCIRVNGAWEQLWGTTLEDLGGYDILHDAQLEARGLMPLIRDAFAGEARHLPTIPYVPPTGKYVGRPRHIRAFIYPVRDEVGQVSEVVLVHEDVTDLVQAEKTMRRAQKLESAGVLAAGVAHEFNNLLTTITGYTTLAARSEGRESRDHLRHVLDASGHATDLVRQLLAYVGEGRVRVERADLRDLTSEVEDLLRASVARSAILTLDPGDEPLPIEADTRQIQQVLTNLVANAGEAMGDRLGRVDVAMRRVHLDTEAIGTRWAGTKLRPGDYVELEVRDDGAGMDEATRERVFDPFFTTKFLGRGLGLAAVLGIVTSHGGAIRVDSAPGQGSTFTVVLPSPEPKLDPISPRTSPHSRL